MEEKKKELWVEHDWEFSGAHNWEEWYTQEDNLILIWTCVKSLFSLYMVIWIVQQQVSEACIEVE